MINIFKSASALPVLIFCRPTTGHHDFVLPTVVMKYWQLRGSPPEIDTNIIIDAVSRKLNREVYVHSVGVEVQALLCLCSRIIHKDQDVSLNKTFSPKNPEIGYCAADSE